LPELVPHTPEELAEALGSAASRRQTITLGGRFSKRLMAGPIEPSDVTVSTAGLTRVLQYEPHDLTISVEAGISYAELSRMLAENRQMIPLDPPFSETATMGGILGSNSSGPRRRLYGTARDLVIGMKFATLEGKIVQSGGMVVKNVAGLDMGKLMIGSFGTLAALAVVNFKLLPMPVAQRTFLLSFDSLEAAIAARNSILTSVLQPAAIDLLNPQAAARLDRQGYLLAIQAGGNAASIQRYDRELSQLADLIALEGGEEEAFWRQVRNFTPSFLESHGDGAVVQVSCTLKELAEVVRSIGVPLVARAGSGVCYAYFAGAGAATAWVAIGTVRGWKAVISFAPESRKSTLELWPSVGSDFEIMKRVKQMFDPKYLLNRGRLYRRI
jgi:glycolate oxidase FAD binding subunit